MRFVSCLSMLCLLLLTACHAHSEDTPPPAVQVSGESVTFAAAAKGIVTEAARDTADRGLVLPARLAWNEDRTVRVFSPFAGRVTRILAQPGDRVATGQTLAEESSPDFGSAQAEHRKAQAALQFATRNLEREQDLFEHGVVSARELQQAQADHAAAVAEAERTEALLRTYGDSGDAVSQVFRLKSPIAGTVVERNVNPGQELRPDQSAAPLFTVTDPLELWVEIEAHEGELRDIHAGQAAVLSTPQYPGESFPAVVTNVAEFVDPATRTVKVRGRVSNPKRQLKGEMYVSARIEVPVAHYALVPVQAVYLRGDAHYLFVATDRSMFTRRRVEVGPEAGSLVPVFEGLQPGERVVTDGSLYLDRLVDEGHS